MEMQIDSKGFNKMIRELKLFTGAKTRSIVRGITEEVLLSASKKTKVGKPALVTKSVLRELRRPFQNPNGDGKYVLTTRGRVWVSPSDEEAKYNWALVKTGAKSPPMTMPKKIPYGLKWTLPKRGGRQISKAKGDFERAKQTVQEARKFFDREKKRRLRHIGIGSASFVVLGQMLGLPMRGKNKLSKRTRSGLSNFPANARRALKAFETVSSRDNYSITVSSFVQSALNHKARGITAFSMALNGKVKEFEKRTEKGVETYARQFAERHGFTVRS